MPKIVTIGGGTGQYQILRGLKHRDCDITAVATMFDDGGSSGKLRDECGVLPPGDARQCLIALSDDEKAESVRFLFNYRFEKGHNLGNLIIAALNHKYGDMASALKAAGKLLSIKGKVLPVTLDDVALCAETENGRTLKGESEVGFPKTKIKRIYLERDAYIHQEVGTDITEADKVVICPGTLYGSTLPNLLVKGIPDLLAKSRAKKIYVCNLFTKEDTRGFKASDFVREVEKYAGITLDDILINSNTPPEEYMQRYLLEKEEYVADDLGADKRVLRDDFLIVYPSEKRTLVRHNPQKVARAIISLR